MEACKLRLPTSLEDIECRPGKWRLSAAEWYVLLHYELVPVRGGRARIGEESRGRSLQRVGVVIVGAGRKPRSCARIREMKMHVSETPTSV